MLFMMDSCVAPANARRRWLVVCRFKIGREGGPPAVAGRTVLTATPGGSCLLLRSGEVGLDSEMSKSTWRIKFVREHLGRVSALP